MIGTPIRENMCLSGAVKVAAANLAIEAQVIGSAAPQLHHGKGIIDSEIPDLDNRRPLDPLSEGRAHQFLDRAIETGLQIKGFGAGPAKAERRTRFVT